MNTGASAPATAEVISIGDEMTSGQRLDTNTQWLSRQLTEVGLRVLYHTTVGDSLEACIRVIREAADRAHVIVCTGGLGPTQDDLTREALAIAAGVELEERVEAVRHLERLFARRGRPMPVRNRLQAQFPRGSQIIPNPQGSAPGIDLVLGRDGCPPARLFALPGVPAEMIQMWDETVRGRLIDQLGLGRRVIRHAVIKCFGLGESEMEERIADLTARDHVPQVGITVSRATIALRILAEAGDEAAAEEQIARVRTLLHERLGALIFGEGDDYELPDAVTDLLAARGQTLCCVEVGHDSLVGQWLSERERPDVFRGAVSLSDRAAAERWRRLLAGEPPIRDEVWLPALAMAVREALETDWVLAISDYPALRNASSAPLEPAEAQLVVCGPSETTATETRVSLGGHPDILKHRIAKAGLDALRHALARS